MLERIRYQTKRVNRRGDVRWYWQRPSFKLTRLPNDPVERFKMVRRLNAIADKRAQAEPTPGSIGWVIAEYQDGDEFRDLSKGTTAYYKRYLRDIEALGPSLPFASFTRRAVVDFIETYPRPPQRRKAAAVLKNLFKIARYYGIVATDETGGLRLKASKPRDRIWSDDEIALWLKAAGDEDAHMTTAFLLLQFTAQRPGDALRMTWPQYSGSAIRLRQQKTGALLDVPVHPVLRDHLNALSRSETSLTIVSYRGRAVRYINFNDRFRRIAERAEIDAQARDLRRTAMLRMAEAGATAPQIASVSGHSIQATQRILETYLSRNRDLAEIAIARLAEYKRGSKV